MRKTLPLEGLDLVRPCPGHESYTRPVHYSEEKKKTVTTTDAEQTDNLLNIYLN